ncbi:uncharacterized protein LOC144862736 [Branchiostoma floridae x Branchiostoma japonicum]
MTVTQSAFSVTMLVFAAHFSISTAFTRTSRAVVLTGVCSMDGDCALARGEGWCCAPWNPWTVYEVSVCKPPGSIGSPCLPSRTENRSQRRSQQQAALERKFWRCPCKHGLVCVPENGGLVGSCQPPDYIV